MKVLGVDVLVVGGGAAGLAAAAASAWSGARTLLLERNSALGGVLEQCIHPGFGVHRYDEELTGPEFSCRLRRELGESGAQVLTDATLLDLEPSGPRALVASPEGLAEVRAKAVVWAAGARERPFGALMIPGSRPAGVFTAGLAQRLVNLHGLLPGQRAVVLGSGDIGLIMARRLRLEGVEVAAVLEIRPFPGGLLRNVVQCLDDFGIPLLLQHTVAAVHGRGRLRGVTAVEVDAVGKALPGRRKFIPCDTLILSVGLIPEVRALAPFVHLDPVNQGPQLNARLQSDLPWLFAAGNAIAVFDLVDTVAELGGWAGTCAARFAAGRLPPARAVPLVRGENVAQLVPTAVCAGEPATLYLRVTRPLGRARVEVGPEVARCPRPGARPAEMVEVRLSGAATEALAALPQARVEVRDGCGSS